MKQKPEYLWAGTSIFLWSTTATVTKLLLHSLNSMQVLVVTSAFAFLFLLAVNAVRGRLGQLKRCTPKDFLQLAGIGLLGTFFYNLFLFLGIDTLDASQAFIINYLWPMMTVVFACIILKERMTLRKVLAIVLSFLGVVVVTARGNLFAMSGESLLGAGYCILAAMAYGLFSVLNKQQTGDKFVSMMLYYLASFLVSALYLLLTKTVFVPQGIQILGLLWIGIGTSAVGFTAWALALGKGDTAKIANLAYITPFLSLLWTVVVLKEPFHYSSLLGLLIIVSGILIQLKEKK